jgi:shikimate dehydrogenase
MAEVIDQYVVVGNPIHHSQSPRIHRLFAAQTHQSLQYDTLLAPLEGFSPTVQAFRERGGKGCNVTVPFKLDAWRLATQRSERANRAEAVNTLQFLPNGEIYGDNTDGVGLVNDLIHNNEITLHDQRILILGAGGAVRGIVAPLLAQHPREIIIANRTPGKAQNIAHAMRDLGNIHGTGLDILATQTFDIVINGTSAGLTSELPALPPSLLVTHGIAYDLVYATSDTPFVQWAKQHGARLAIDGLGMLVEQAAEAFYVWRNVRPDTKPVITTLRGAERNYREAK